MRWNTCLISISLAAALASAAMPSRAATFGTVVPIAGAASDIALDESRGLLYIANFTANRIEVMSTADYSIRSSMNVAPQPGALALSFDSQFLLIAHAADVRHRRSAAGGGLHRRRRGADRDHHQLRGPRSGFGRHAGIGHFRQPGPIPARSPGHVSLPGALRRAGHLRRRLDGVRHRQQRYGTGVLPVPGDGTSVVRHRHCGLAHAADF